jgi:transcription-repair coupling factor (superfamily II helicase)
MLNEAVKNAKGDTTEEEAFETSMDMDMDAYIPSSYIKNEVQKLDIYKRIADISDEEELLDMKEELLDRFGDIPAPVNNLLNIALLKSVCHCMYVNGVVHKDSEVKLIMYPKARIEADKIPAVIEKYKGALKFIPQANPYFIYRIPSNAKAKPDTPAVFEHMYRLLEDFRQLKA